jgi:transcriptional regulator with XRE-family HTH domain
MNFAGVFKIARRRLGLSQSEAARKWSVPLKALQNWEQGVRTPRAQTLLRLLPILFPRGLERRIQTKEEEKKGRGPAPATTVATRQRPSQP